MMGLIDKSQKKKADLSFYSEYSKDLKLKFECVIGKNVLHSFPMHIHDSLCIGLVTKGQRNMVWSNKPEIINQGEIFVVNVNQPHAVDSVNFHDYIIITIKGAPGGITFENIINSHVCINLFYQLFNAIQEGDMLTLCRKWETLFEYLFLNHKLQPLSAPEEESIQKILKYIEINYHDQISVDEIAGQACKSTYHFCRLFKKSTGLTPHNYLRQFRLNQSYRYLQQNIPVFDTAIETGFYDSSHFIRTFHSYMAVSPKEYQKSIIKQ